MDTLLVSIDSFVIRGDFFGFNPEFLTKCSIDILLRLKAEEDVKQRPDTHEWEREEFLETFIELVNTIEPKHPRFRDQDDVWPITPEDVEFGVKRGSMWASCGPRCYHNKIFFSLNASRVREMPPPKVLMLFVHEATHIVEGNHTDGSGHNKAFWREFAFLALETRDALRDGELSWPSDERFVQEFLARVVEDARSVVIDRRQWNQEEARHQVAEWLHKTDCRFAPKEWKVE